MGWNGCGMIVSNPKATLFPFEYQEKIISSGPKNAKQMKIT